MKKAFTIIEVIIFISSFGILLLVILPIIKNINQNIRFKATTEKIENLKKAIIGDLDEIVENKRIEGGYFSDTGQLPSNLDDLVTNPGLPGWNGPYIEYKNGLFKIDGWGNQFFYDKVNGIIRSNGPDGVSGNSDDITSYIYSPISNLTQNTIRVYVRDANGRILDNTYLEVGIRYPFSSSWTALSYTNGYFYLNNVPCGVRHILRTKIINSELGQDIEKEIVVYPLGNSKIQNYTIDLYGEIKETL